MAWIFYLLLAVGAVLWIGWRQGAIPLDVFVDYESWWLDLAAGVTAALLLLGVWELARRNFAQARRLEVQLSEHLGPLQPGEAVALALLSNFFHRIFYLRYGILCY